MPAEDGVAAILLFGSRARGDNDRGSDTDLLLIGPPEVRRHKSIGHLSMFFYSWEKLAADARDGDLFVCHLVREAKVVFDPQGLLDELRSLFRLRGSYSAEIGQARDLGWFLDRHASALSPSFAIRRMIWCVRTILIARLAESGTPAFSPSALAAVAPATAAELLVRRHQRRLDLATRQRFRQFMLAEGGPRVLSVEATIGDYHRLFAQTKNEIALQTLARSEHDDDYESYTR